MPTLYVENIPKELYAALRGKARERRRSIAAEVLALLEECVPTRRELKARKLLRRTLAQMRTRKSSSHGPFPST